MAKISTYTTVDAAEDDKLLGTDISDTSNDAGGETVTFTPVSVVNAGLTEQRTGNDGVLAIEDQAIVKLEYLTEAGAIDRSFGFDATGAFILRTLDEDAARVSQITPATFTSASNVVTFDFDNSKTYGRIVMTEDTTITLANIPDDLGVRVLIVGDGTNPFDLTWPAGTIIFGTESNSLTHEVAANSKVWAVIFHDEPDDTYIVTISGSHTVGS